MLLVPALCATLTVTVSRSSVVGLVAGLAAIWPKSKKWLIVIAVIGVACYISLFTLFRDTGLVDNVVSRAGDVSAESRVNQFAQVKGEIYDWGIGGTLLGSGQSIHQENYYFSILLRSGLVGLLFLCLPLVVTLHRVRHPFLKGGIVSLATASLFVPYLDIFPPNVYFWLLVGAAWSLTENRSTVRRYGSNAVDPVPLMQGART
jgi:hypothetical protein